MIRNALLCTIATLTLAACGGGSSDSGSAATAAETDTATALVSPNAGTIDRSQSADGSANASSVASTTAPTTGAATPPSGSTTPVKTINGVATLDWEPPTQNNDGTILTNLAGYTVYYGTSPSDLSQSVKVSNPGLASYTVTGLTSGTWYFAITAYSVDGVESSRTSTVSTRI
jgi:fibronectin type III domain protein